MEFSRTEKPKMVNQSIPITGSNEHGDDVQILQEHANDWCDVSANRQSQAWTYFWYKSGTKEAKCKTCDQIFSAKNGTHSLNQHLKSKHSVYY